MVLQPDYHFEATFNIQHFLVIILVFIVMVALCAFNYVTAMSPIPPYKHFFTSLTTLLKVSQYFLYVNFLRICLRFIVIETRKKRNHEICKELFALYCDLSTISKHINDSFKFTMVVLISLLEISCVRIGFNVFRVTIQQLPVSTKVALLSELTFVFLQICVLLMIIITSPRKCSQSVSIWIS